MFALPPLPIRQPQEKKPKSGRKGAQEELEDESEFFKLEDAYWFPVIGSATLLGLYVLFKYIDKDYVNYLLTAYFGLLGVGALFKMVLDMSRSVTGLELKGDYNVQMWKKETGTSDS